MNITTVGAGTDAPPTTTGAAAGPTTTVSWTWRASGLRPVMAGSPAAAAIAAFAVRATLAAIAATVAAGAAAAGASAATATGRAAPFLRTGSSKMLVNRSVPLSSKLTAWAALVYSSGVSATATVRRTEVVASAWIT